VSPVGRSAVLVGTLWSDGGEDSLSSDVGHFLEEVWVVVSVKYVLHD
jgi:hypothetical protein